MKIMILAMGRSGSSAIKAWVLQNLLGAVTFYNNCTRGWGYRKFIGRKARSHTTKKGNPCSACQNEKTVIEIHGKDMCYCCGNEVQHSEVYSIEDFYLPLWNKYHMSSWKQQFDKVITIVRSPRNWLASSILAPTHLGIDYKDKYLDSDVRKGGNYEIPGTRIDAFEKYIELYESMIKNFTTDVVPNCIVVNYDKWCDDKQYRMVLAKAIGLKGYKKPDHCIFSSFGHNHNYTSNRYLLLSKDQKKRFDNLYNNTILRRFQEKYFK